jgi:hypothetical protein
MPNVTVNSIEANWLSQQIRLVYESTNPPLGKLTGTIAIYEKIAFFMQQRVEMPRHLLEYYQLLPDSTWKFYLRKSGLETGRADALARKYGQALSPNSLRKLIFERLRQADYPISFQEDFIHACYIFLSKDRLHLLPQFVESGIAESGPSVKTINPYTIPTGTAQETTLDIFQPLPRFKLQPLLPGSEVDPHKEELPFAGTSTMLNRDNLEPNNLTITSKVQALIRWENNHWVIENQSELQTTMLQVSRPTTLQSGDIIVIGNRKFRFLLE